MDEKIVITGTGAITAVGHSTRETWENIINGVSGAGPITQFDASEFLVNVACEVKDFDPAEHIERREVRRRDRYQQFAAVAVKEALAESGLEITPENAGGIGVILSSAIGGLGTLEENVKMILESGPRKVSPFMIPMLMSNGAAGLVGIDYGAKGPAFSVASACASGQDGIGMAWMMLKSGMIDVAITGASEATVTPVGVAAFDRLRATSRAASDEPAPRPFDKNRDGLVVGEGSGILVLEKESHAKARDAEILAELAGYSATADAFHITAPSEDGSGGSAAMVRALEVAGVNPDEVGYISAHGTATPLNDKSETLAIKSAFGETAYNIPISSTKSMTGHMMGATGAVETVLCVQAVRENVAPPTINYETPDPDCDLDYVPNQARQTPIDVAISNAFGFGGHNAVVVVRKYDG
ncbi:MAG: beta-ketoacyl-[acyl-carrier-protein] synthase II [Chloroflexi bacterium]|nr:MAG: beta-ketoacyl-[acyl-carrier-protein] synthase II [Chloroflexota bacterium]MBL1193562.1 beta-ketoacyl-[acyl-carrier-protein] synthase II [Chloroflexota bacterium]NOH10853.1 beta-ketoacyl-ACP synthase II [Chloroflexota bacterium]